MNATVSGHDAYERWMLDRWDRYARKDDDCLRLVCDVCGKSPWWSLPRVDDPCPDDDGRLIVRSDLEGGRRH